MATFKIKNSDKFLHSNITTVLSQNPRMTCGGIQSVQNLEYLRIYLLRVTLALATLHQLKEFYTPQGKLNHMVSKEIQSSSTQS